jgi:hypothetical protein
VNYDCITGYEPSQIPNLARLATGFAISDHTFSMANSPSWGGHLYAVAGTLDGFEGSNPYHGLGLGAGWGCDSRGITYWMPPFGPARTVPSCVPDYALNPVRYPYGGAFEKTPVQPVPTIMDRLDAAGLPWKIYGAVKGARGYGTWDICPTFAGCLDTSQDANLVPDRQFATDAASGSLPAFSVVTPGGPDVTSSCHNKFSMTACDNWIGSLVQDAENSPDWASTAVFITFDDCGCFYDQVSPPATLNADGQQAGPRVPLIIVSPYAKPRYTDKTATTFAGILAYTERVLGLPPLSVNDARAYPFTNAFNYSQAPLRPVPMVTRPLPPGSRHIHLTPAELNDPT